MKTVIERAREAGFEVDVYPEAGLLLRLERFVNFARADEREAILKLADSLGWVDVDYIKARGDK